MANWKKVLVSGSAIEVRNITASGLPESSDGNNKVVVINPTTGYLAYTSSAAGGGGVFVDQGDFANTGNGTPKSIYITGSVLQPSPDTAPTETRGASAVNSNYALVVSQSAYFSNHNVGHPNSLAWGSNLDGSIFSNYNANTDVSEILRTMLGLMSASSAANNFIDVSSPTPNSTNFAGANVEPENKPSSPIASYWTNAYIPQSYTDSTVLYLDTKGFNDGAGDAILGNVNVTKYSQSHDDFGIRLDSLPSPSTLFDAGLKDTNFTVFAMASQSFSDNQADANPDENSTFTTSSFFQTIQNGAGTTNGVTVATINTSNPTVIPPQFQEAQFTNFPLITDRRFKASGEDFTSISASGYYRYHDIKVGIATGSTDVADIIGGTFTAATNTNNATDTFFITPLNPSDISDNTITINTGTADMITAASRSLSGAPYLNQIGYRINNFTASGMFDPLFYGGSSNIGELTIDDDIGITHTISQLSTLRSRAQGGTINTGYENIWNVTLNSQASPGVIPPIDSKILFHDALVVASTIDYQTNELEGSTPTDTGFGLTMTIRKYNNTTTSDNITKAYHTAGTFGQPAASGAMSVFMSKDGDDTAPGGQESSTSTEYFGGEKYRRPIEATTDLANSNAWDSGSRLTLGNGGGLQVKPGYLVNPESSNGYWYPTGNYSDTDYKWYLREFDTGESGTALNLVLTFNSTTNIVPLSTTTADKIGIGVLLEYQLNNLGGGNPKIYDVGNGYDTGDNGDVSLGQATSNQYNPFSDTVDVTSNWGDASATSTAITLNLAAGAGQVINSTYSKIYLLVRYTGTPGNTLESIAVSTT